MIDVPVTLGKPHFLHERHGRIIDARYLVIFDDDHRAVWYDARDIPDITLTKEEP